MFWKIEYGKFVVVYYFNFNGYTFDVTLIRFMAQKDLLILCKWGQTPSFLSEGQEHDMSINLSGWTLE
jgi:hypothetical protein